MWLMYLWLWEGYTSLGSRYGRIEFTFMFVIWIWMLFYELFLLSFSRSGENLELVKMWRLLSLTLAGRYIKQLLSSKVYGPNFSPNLIICLNLFDWNFLLFDLIFMVWRGNRWNTCSWVRLQNYSYYYVYKSWLKPFLDQSLIWQGLHGKGWKLLEWKHHLLAWFWKLAYFLIPSNWLILNFRVPSIMFLKLVLLPEWISLVGS